EARNAALRGIALVRRLLERQARDLADQRRFFLQSQKFRPVDEPVRKRRAEVERAWKSVRSDVGESGEVHRHATTSATDAASGLTSDMSGSRQQAKLDVGCPLDGRLGRSRHILIAFLL